MTNAGFDGNLIVPVKGIAAGKSRLAGKLAAGDRQALVSRLLNRTLDIAATVVGHRRIVVVSPDDAALDLAAAHGVRLLKQRGDGLNAALDQAVAAAAPDEATIVLMADLPTIEAADVAALVGARPIAIAPDRFRDGTNALRLSSATGFRFHFEDSSFAAHLAEAERHAMTATVIERPGLAFDLDTADDLAAMKGWP